MKEYVIKLEEEEKSIINSDGGEEMTEVACALKIWRDLSKVNSQYAEDKFIKKLLEKILEVEFNGVENIPTPDYYAEKNE